jgi:hypothetical protein
MDAITTADKGASYTGEPPVIEIGLIVYKKEMSAKYRFAVFENWVIRFSGMNVNTEYFAVRIWFALNF